MDLKKIIGVLGFLIFGFIPQVDSQVLYQALLFTSEDTLTMWDTFIKDAAKSPEMTSEREEMSLSSCMFGGYFPTWKIENDSIFLVKLIDQRDRDSTVTVDLKIAFRERCINERVFERKFPIK
jgi:hypothetical protein